MRGQKQNIGYEGIVDNVVIEGINSKPRHRGQINGSTIFKVIRTYTSFNSGQLFR